MPSEFLKRLYASLPIIRELRMINSSLQKIGDAVSVSAAVDAIRLADLDLKTHPRYGSPKRLTAYEKSINSQNGEDGIIKEIFKRIGSTDKRFVEVGVADGNECNTSFLLSQGWTGCWIDGGGKFQATLQNRPDLRDGRLKTLQAFVNRENICSLFEQLQVPPEFDLLSLDIDLNTYYAWEGLDKFRPRVIVIEYNSVVPPDREWKVAYEPTGAWDRTNNYGASLKSLELLGRTRGYSLVACDFTGVNAFFVRDDLVAEKFEAPFTAENHYEPPRFTLSLFRRGHNPAILQRHGS